MAYQTDSILKQIQPLREKLLNHDLYKYIETPDDLRIFTLHHVFAVWDYMSLLKTLQQKLTCINVPWTPNPSPEYTYLINEIVLGEETDTNFNGERQSHFAMYLEAMKDLQSSSNQIHEFLKQIKHGTDIFLVISTGELPKSVKSFLIFTFNTIYHEQTHQVASAFAYGREDLVPKMFLDILDNIQRTFPDDNISKLKYYFKRDVKSDSPEHNSKSIQLVENLCGNDVSKWEEVKQTATKSLEKRLELFDGILRAILNHKAIA